MLINYMNIDFQKKIYYTNNRNKNDQKGNIYI